MKPTAATQRVFRDPSPRPPFRRKQHRRRQSRESSSDTGSRVDFQFREVSEGRGQQQVKLAPMVKVGGSLRSRVDSKSVRLGGVLGLIAIGFVAALWLGVLMNLIVTLIGWDTSFWVEWTGGAFVIGLYGVHLFGVAGTSLSRGYRNWGVIAIVAFWAGLLGWIPFGILLQWLS